MQVFCPYDIKQNLQMSWLSNMYQEHKLYLNMNTSANKCLSICTTKGSTNITQLLHIWHTFLLLYHQHTLHKSIFFFDLFPCKPKRNPAVKHNTLKFSPKNIFGWTIPTTRYALSIEFFFSSPNNFYIRTLDVIFNQIWKSHRIQEAFFC